MGLDAVAGSDFEVIKDKEHFYAGEDGWANRTGAFCTRYMNINVDDLAFESSCIKTQEDLLAAIERINSLAPPGEDNSELIIEPGRVNPFVE